MKILAVSTAEKGASLALLDQGLLVGEVYWCNGRTHSTRLLSMIEEMVTDLAGWPVSEIDGFIAARGPGSFTGLRIGIGLVKGLAFGLSRPCAGVSSLDGIGLRFSQVAGPVCVMMDAKRGEVYTAVFRFENGQMVEKSPEKVCPPETAIRDAGEGALFAGSGARAYQDLVLDLTKARARFAPPGQNSVSAAALARVALGTTDFFSRSQNLLVPTYLRKSDAEIHAART